MSKKLNLSISYFIYRLFCRLILRTKKNLLIDKGTHLVKDQMDVTKVIKKMQEIDKLKHILLHKD